MLFKTLVIAAITAFAASAQADCTTGKILGKFAICGSDPVDCGSGLCCLAGSTCVSDDNTGVFRCAMPLLSLDPTSTTNDTVLLDAGCYDVVARTATPSSTASSSTASNTGSSSDQSQASSQNTSSKSKLSKGAVAGIIVGSVIGGLLLIAIIATLFLLARRRKDKTRPAAEAVSSREMGERSNSSNSGLQKPAPAVLGDRSSTAKLPRPQSSRVSSGS